MPLFCHPLSVSLHSSLFGTLPLAHSCRLSPPIGTPLSCPQAPSWSPYSPKISLTLTLSKLLDWVYWNKWGLFILTTISFIGLIKVSKKPTAQCVFGYSEPTLLIWWSDIEVIFLMKPKWLTSIKTHFPLFWNLNPTRQCESIHLSPFRLSLSFLSYLIPSCFHALALSLPKSTSSCPTL